MAKKSKRSSQSGGQQPSPPPAPFGPQYLPGFTGAASSAPKTQQFPEKTREGSDFQRLIAAIKLLGWQPVTRAGQVMAGDRPRFFVAEPRAGCARFTDGTNVAELSAYTLYVWSGLDGSRGRSKETSVTTVVRALNDAIARNDLELWQESFANFIKGVQ